MIGVVRPNAPTDDPCVAASADESLSEVHEVGRCVTHRQVSTLLPQARCITNRSKHNVLERRADYSSYWFFEKSSEREERLGRAFVRPRRHSLLPTAGATQKTGLNPSLETVG